MFERARAAQKAWALLSTRKRAKILLQVRDSILNQLDSVEATIQLENGKPKHEALTHDILPSLELATFFGKNAAKILEPYNLQLNNPILFLKKSRIEHSPLGVTAVIAPWNFPFYLPFAEIFMALIAGNAVIFKPSEVTPRVGLKIQEVFEQAGLPKDLLQTVLGDGSRGVAIIDQKPAKVFFTGSVETGKKIMAQAARSLTPVNLELGGKDAMIVLSDADLDFATSAALWGAFTNSGQLCASTERLLVHESIAKPFTELLQKKLSQLRQGDPAKESVDLGPFTYEKQKAVYASQIDEAKARGLEFITGGEFDPSGRYLRPTLVRGDGIEDAKIYTDETFGPVLAITTFRTPEEAIEKANRSRYGLLASVISKNMRLATQIARALEVGTVTLNEVAYTAGIPETPWGGMKESGFGKRHSAAGLLEFVHVKHLHRPRWGGLLYKSLWWFPYTPFQYQTFRSYLQFYRGGKLEKLKNIPIFLWNLTQFLKNEKRI